MRTRELIKTAIRSVLRYHFPHDTVDVSDGYGENIHVVVVSRKFDSMTDREAADYLWSLLKGSLTEEEQGLISLIRPVSIAEIK